MRIDIMTLFPESVGDMLNESILGRAAERGYIRIECHQIRDYTLNKQKQVDDYPYGGGRGAVMQADPLYQCWKHICDEAGERIHTIYFSPCGETFRQETAKRLAANYDRLLLVCGHYEGIDERFIEECVDEEISMGDFVLTGGEIPAMALADAVCRLVPGVLPDAEYQTANGVWYPACCPTRSAIWRNPIGTACWNIPNIPGPRSGTAAMCRRSCCPATTRRWRNGAKRNPTSARCAAVRI